MPVPDFQSFFKPLLEIATDGKEHSLKEAREKIAEYFNLTDEYRAELLPSGNQTKNMHQKHLIGCGERRSMQTPFHGSLPVKDSAEDNLIFPLYSTSPFKFDKPSPQGIHKRSENNRIGMTDLEGQFILCLSISLIANHSHNIHYWVILGNCQLAF